MASYSVSAGHSADYNVTTNTASGTVQSSGNQVPNVTFASPASGAGVTFSGGGTATTDAQGNASLSVTANGDAGFFTVTASVSGSATSASFTLTNSPLAVTGTAPAFTSLDSTTFVTTVSGRFTATFTGTSPVTVAESGALPNGVTFTPATGVFGGQAFQKPTAVIRLERFRGCCSGTDW